ncbi:unnamed protein product [Auanema sp. JU1783]|nr:unnamed protein product [Auanema sp. JU1783]
MVLNYHIQINIYGDSLIKIVHENISLENILKKNGINEFVIVEIPHQPIAPSVQEKVRIVTNFEREQVNKKEEEEEPVEEYIFQDPGSVANWYCSTPLHANSEPPVLEKTDYLLEESSSQHSSSNEVHSAVLGTVDNMISFVESCAEPTEELLDECSLFSGSASCPNVISKPNETEPCHKEVFATKIEKSSNVKCGVIVDMDNSFQSCTSALVGYKEKNMEPNNQTTDSSMLRDMRDAMDLGNTTESPNESLQTLESSFSENESRGHPVQNFTCQYSDCQRKLRVSWKKGYAGLREHVRQHTNELIRSCMHCQYGFRTLYQLRKHHQAYHSDIRFRIPKTTHDDNVIIHKLLAVCFPSIFTNNPGPVTTLPGYVLTPSGRMRKVDGRRK